MPFDAETYVAPFSQKKFEPPLPKPIQLPPAARPSLAELRLQRARALIERGWTQGVLAQDSYGERYGVSLKNVRPSPGNSYCSVGALHEATREHDGHPPILYGLIKFGAYARACKLLRRAIAEFEGRKRSIVDFNDDNRTRQADVLHVFDRAIELERSKR